MAQLFLGALNVLILKPPTTKAKQYTWTVITDIRLR
jgi:hypothetical protein